VGLPPWHHHRDHRLKEDPRGIMSTSKRRKPSTRQRPGKPGARRVSVLTATIVLVVGIVAATGRLVAVILGLVFLAAYLAGRYFQRRLGGITGDTIGAVNEFSEISVLFIAVLWERGWL